MIDINNITVRIAGKILLEHASAHIADGWKVGLVGANGCGKSTLFKVLLNELETESGAVNFPSGQKIVQVEQEIRETDLPILEFVLSRDRERSALLQKLETADPEEVAEINERLTVLGAASAEARAAEILHGLGFSQDELHRPVREFSGGWRMRLALAGALFQPSDVLLLDEPTNHLDLEASLWLENHLRGYRGTLLLISHDRFILNDLCDHIVHFEGCRLNNYGGNYEAFCRVRAEKRDLLVKLAEKQEKRRAHLQSFVDRFRYKASKAKQAQSRLKMLEKLETLPELVPDASTSFDFPEPALLAPPLLSVSNGQVGYDGRPVLNKLNFSIAENDRIALLGANGNGKSTLAKLIAGRLPLQDGEYKASSKLKIGYFAQHQTEELPLEETPVQYLTRLMPDNPEPKVRAHLARFGLGQEKALTVIDKLSGGEKARLLFAVMTIDAPQLLILDEPTNHLDIDGRDALVSALNTFSGAVILITHDLLLVELAAETLWLIKDGVCRNFDGDMQDYRNLLLGLKTPAAKAETSERPNGRQQREQALALRSERTALKGQISRLEKELESLRTQHTQLEKRFMENLPGAEIVVLQKELSAVAERLSQSEDEWLELAARLEELPK